MSDDYTPLHIPPASIYLGKADPADWRHFSPQQQRILRGVFAGRVIPLRTGKIKNNQYIPSWLEIFGSVEEARNALGTEIFEGVLKITVDHVSIKLAAVQCRTSSKSGTGYAQFGKTETLLRQMPSRFTWDDMIATKKGSTSEVRRMSFRSIAATLYLHIVAGNIEYIPNPHHPENASFRKISAFFDVPSL